MQFFTDIAGAQGAILTFAMASGAKLPAAAQSAFAAGVARPSPVDNIVNAAECLYANQAAITDPTTKAAAQTLAAQLAQLAAANAWHGMEARGPGITAAMRRELGETAPAGTTWPAASSDPPPLPAWLPQSAPAAH